MTQVASARTSEQITQFAPSLGQEVPVAALATCFRETWIRVEKLYLRSAETRRRIDPGSKGGLHMKADCLARETSGELTSRERP